MSEAAKIKCYACEDESDWVCRKCYHHIVLVCVTYEQQRDKARAEVEQLLAVKRRAQEERERAKRFQIVYKVDVALNASALWPDGDMPKEPNAEQVRELIEESGGILRVIDEWNLGGRDFDVFEAEPKKGR